MRDLNLWSDLHAEGHREATETIAALASVVLRLRTRLARLERQVRGHHASA